MPRAQTACSLTVRFTWEVAEGHHHPEFTFTCSEDVEMAVTAARLAAEVAPTGIRLTNVDVSESGGRFGPWEPLNLEEAT